MKKELVFITVIGKDKKGIVARISMTLFKRNINIEDITQKIIEDHFIMAMLVDIKQANCSVETIVKDLEKIGKQMGLIIQVQHENIFKMMHRI
ncbi:MAG TPA: ACT domain-containing protein [bacterium]|nr:ACT domain-containing protein [bacterium]HOL49063.1 ACT domain-containing protein [bacterium]HPO52336.1 ACT domain-containing protein [bacterium]HXK45699.1 ACT domain-containing protein [bacterium]